MYNIQMITNPRRRERQQRKKTNLRKRRRNENTKKIKIQIGKSFNLRASQTDVLLTETAKQFSVEQSLSVRFVFCVFLYLIIISCVALKRRDASANGSHN